MRWHRYNGCCNCSLSVRRMLRDDFRAVDILSGMRSCRYNYRYVSGGGFSDSSFWSMGGTFGGILRLGS